MNNVKAHEIRAVVIGAILAALVLRLLNLGGKSLWFDEAYNLANVSSGIDASWPQMLWPPTLENHHPPLYYVVLRSWIAFGYTEFWLRLLPALCGTLSVAVVFAIGKVLAGGAAGVTAAGLAAFSPLMIWYSQEARSYSALTLLGLCATYFAVRLFQAPAAWKVGLFAAFMTAAFYTHYGAVLLIPLQLMLFVALLANNRSRVSALVYWGAGVGIVAIAFYPWLITPAAQEFLIAIRTGSYPGQMIASRLGIGADLVVISVLIATVVGGVIAAWGLYYLVKQRLLDTTPQSARRIDLGLFAFVVLVIGLACVLPRAYSFKKQLLVLWPYGLVALGWWWPWNVNYRMKVMTAWGISLAFALVNVFAVPKDNWRDVSAYVAAQSRPGDSVVLVPSYSVYVFEYYNRGLVPVVSHEVATSRPAGTRIWYITNREETADPTKYVRRALSERATMAGSQSFYRVRVDLFETTQ